MTTKCLNVVHFATIFMILEENLHDYEQQFTFCDIVVDILQTLIHFKQILVWIRAFSACLRNFTYFSIFTFHDKFVHFQTNVGFC